MERSSNVKSSLKFSKQKTVSSAHNEEPQEQLAPRRAAQLASKRWQKVNESESSADFSEEDDSVGEEESDSDHYYRTSRKRSAPSKGTPVEPEDKTIKTEQFL